MSMNITMVDYHFPFQTPTNLSYEAIDQGGAGPLEQDLKTVEFLRCHYLEEFCPALTGKDARNPYLRRKRQDDIDWVNDRLVDVVRVLKSRAPYAERQLYVT